MPVVSLSVVKEHRVENVVDFVESFGLEKLFKEIYGCDIDEWDFEESDYEVIVKLLNKAFPKKLWYVEYHDDGNLGYFIIYELNESEPLGIL